MIAPDMLGFGNSASPKGYAIYSSNQHAKRIIELMNHLNIEQWNHVMHDAGGLWTWELMLAYPNRIKRLVILNTLVFEEGFHPPVRMKKGGKAKIAMWAYRNWFTRPILMKGLFKSTLKKETCSKLTKEDKKGYKEPLQEGKTRGMYYFFTQTKAPFTNYSVLFESLNIPITVIWGKYDEMLQIEPQREKIKKYFNIKDRDIHVLDAKHFIQEEKPEEVVSIMEKFIKTQ